MRCAWQHPGSAARASRTRRRHQSGRGRSIRRLPGVASALNRTKYTGRRASVPGSQRAESARALEVSPLRCGGDAPAASSAARPCPTRRSRSRRHGSTIRTPTGASTSTPPAARSSSTSATAGARSRRRWPTRPAASPTPTAARSRPSRSRRTPREVGAAPADRRPGDLPGVGRLGGDRDGAQARPRLPPRPRRDRTAGSCSRGGGATTATRSGALDLSGPQAAPPPVRGLARPVPARLRGLPVPRRACRAPNALGTADELAAELDRAFEAAGPGTVAAFVAEPIVGRDAGRRGPARRLLAGDRRGLPPPRRAAHRRRGDDRVRADRALVRARPLGRPAGHPRRRQGRDVGLLAVRVRGGVGRGPRHGDAAGPGFVHGFTYSHAPVGAAVAREVLRILEDGVAGRGERDEGRAALARSRRPRSASTRPSARSAVAA